MARIHNFAAGPCVLPVSVLETLAANMADYQGSGMSLIEMSHRGPVYDEIHRNTLASLRRLYGVPDEFKVLLLQGGATLQFAMIPMNLLADGDKAAYVVSGTWAKKAIADANQVGTAYPAWDGSDAGFTRMPSPEEIELEDGTRYLHITSNETIGGIRMNDFPDLGVPLVGDMSSDYMTRPIPWDRFDLVYGGAQKSLGPAGLTVVFVRETAIADNALPNYLSYPYHIKGNSMANTPPVFAIWATGLTLNWMEENGGVEGMMSRAATRSGLLYDAIDSTGGFYVSPVDPGSRSHTNIVFRIADNDLESVFVEEAAAAGFANLKGHRSVGGIRASVYNGLETESVEALVEFMASFAAARG